jgi:hypothetical protein
MCAPTAACSSAQSTCPRRPQVGGAGRGGAGRGGAGPPPGLAGTRGSPPARLLVCLPARLPACARSWRGAAQPPCSSSSADGLPLAPLPCRCDGRARHQRRLGRQGVNRLPAVRLRCAGQRQTQPASQPDLHCHPANWRQPCHLNFPLEPSPAWPQIRATHPTPPHPAHPSLPTAPARLPACVQASMWSAWLFPTSSNTWSASWQP